MNGDFYCRVGPNHRKPKISYIIKLLKSYQFKGFGDTRPGTLVQTQKTHRKTGLDYQFIVIGDLFNDLMENPS